MRPKPILDINSNKLTDFSAKENGFGCVQNQFWMNANKLNDFSAYKNGFGCIQNQTDRSIRKTSLALALTKMVLDASKTNSR